MNITIINGTPDGNWGEFEKEITASVHELSKSHTVDLFTVRDMDINYCCGCFSCWIKTPGLCVFKDDMDAVLRSLACTNYLMIISPLISGFLSSETKRTLDRIIPTVLPYIQAFNGECHHPKRYDNEANLGVILYGEDMDPEATEIVFDVIDRLALNFHAIETFKSAVTSNNLQEVFLNEIRTY